MLKQTLTLGAVAAILVMGVAGTAAADPTDWVDYATPDYEDCDATGDELRECAYAETKSWLQEQYPPPCTCPPVD